MKFDVDTILYIIISIVIIAASTLGRKKKKRIEQASQQPQAEGEQETGNFPLGAFSEVKTIFEAVSEQFDPRLDGEYDLEGQPLEQIVDEDEMILEAQKIREEKEADMQEQVLEEEVSAERVTEDEEAQELSDQEKEEGFFNDPSDIRMAVIYSEILKRPEY